MTNIFNWPEPGKKILLLNTHADDLRLPWSSWHQPTGLLQLGSALKRRGCDTRFIDCLIWSPKTKVKRRKITTVAIEGYRINVWRYGVLDEQLNSYVKNLKSSNWVPDEIYVSCSQTTWWQAAQDLIAFMRNWFPKAKVILGGVYPTLEPRHATINSGADEIFIGSVPDIQQETPDFSLYESIHRPVFAGVYLYGSQNVLDTRKQLTLRDPLLIAEEIKIKAEMGVREFTFFDEIICSHHREHFLDTLQAICDLELDISFIIQGNLSPDFVDGEIAKLMGKTGFKQVYLHSDVEWNEMGSVYTSSYEAYRCCVDAFVREAGFKNRTGDITAMQLVGNPYEDIEQVAERLIHLASIVGSVNLIQFAYSNGTFSGELYKNLINRIDDEIDLSKLNCKLYPFGRSTGVPFDDYIELTRLSALLNSKYRSTTFDFMGEGIVAEAIRESIRTEGWEPSSKKQETSSPDIIPLIPMEEKEFKDDSKG